MLLARALQCKNLVLNRRLAGTPFPQLRIEEPLDQFRHQGEPDYERHRSTEMCPSPMLLPGFTGPEVL